MTNTNYGILLKKAAVLVGEVTNLGFPELIQEAIEKTNHSSAGVREFVSSQLKEVAEFVVSINAVQAGLTILEADLSAGTTATYNIEYSADLDLLNWAFTAFPTNIALQDADAQTPGVMSYDVTFRPTGDVTISG